MSRLFRKNLYHHKASLFTLDFDHEFFSQPNFSYLYPYQAIRRLHFAFITFFAWGRRACGGGASEFLHSQGLVSLYKMNNALWPLMLKRTET